MADVFRYKIVVMGWESDEEIHEALRVLGIESWDLVSVIPGRAGDPNDASVATYFFKRDASTDIGL